MGAPQYQLPPLAVIQMAVKEKKRELRRTWFSAIGAWVLLLMLEYTIGGPLSLWYVLVIAVLAVLVWRYLDLSTDITWLRWQKAYAKGALNQPLEEPKDWSKGKLALLLTFVVGMIGVIAQLVSALH
jgi:hypothetical protein